MDTTEFQEVLWEKARELYRDMPWRADTRPYYVLVSEIMLQQTQVDRVIPKFEAFIMRFPDITSLAEASLSEVLLLWSGLGYNRRAKYLHEAAKRIVQECDGIFPEDRAGLMALPGVGENTAGALMAYSFNQPSVFIETNVRTVLFHHFYYDDAASVTDKELKALVETLVDREHPREWYWGIMDYGSFLKRQGVGQNQKSAHYKRQSPLKGSVREVRGQIVALLTTGPLLTGQLLEQFAEDARYPVALEGLKRDGLVIELDGRLQLAS